MDQELEASLRADQGARQRRLVEEKVARRDEENPWRRYKSLSGGGARKAAAEPRRSPERLALLQTVGDGLQAVPRGPISTPTRLPRWGPRV